MSKNKTDLQKLWKKCHEKDREARKVMIDIVIDDAIERFGLMFTPYRFMGSSKKCGRAFRRQDITVTFEHRLLFNNGEEDADAALGIASDSVLTPLLVSAENVVRHYLKLKKGVPTLAGFTKAVHAITHGQHIPATHVWAGREVASAFMSEDEWRKYVLRDDRTDDQIVNGNACRILDLDVHSDIFRHDTMQVLDNDEWGVFSNQDKKKVWVDFAPEQHVRRKTILSYTLRIGTEKSSDV